MKILENDLCKINYSESLFELAKDTLKLLEEKISEYNIFFCISIDEKVIVNYFDDINDFRNFIYDIRGERKSLPDYASGTYDKGMINAYVDPVAQLQSRYTASHELFHILYMKYILNNNYSKRIVWYDEGMAQYMSGEKDYLYNISNFKKYYCKVRSETKIIPNLNEIEHGDSFCNDNFNGYDLSYLAVRYLSETLNSNEFRKLMINFLDIKHIGTDIIEKMFDYYDKRI